ncbi:MAG: hypothetical protein ACTHMC_25440, partial [Pseudobacter sp.]|uniref:hypothetical protein n=1 Tax=Pseudobacter sp. TaxID=2045420 RepID=UPI003F7F3B74
YDQVASSVEVDRELPIDRFPNNSEEIGTLRFWDMAQAGSEDKFPPFSKSILANTIGVAVAVYTLNENNQKVYVTRKRTDEEIMTYRDTEHLIFSFALKLDENNPVPKQGTIQDLIRSSYEKEEKSEIGLIINSFENVKPLALCREMIRGGKPQFFLEVKSKLSYEELKKHITEIPDEHDKEFLPEYLPNTLNGDLSFHKKSITPNEQLQKVIDFISTRKISSELFASLLLSFK